MCKICDGDTYIAWDTAYFAAEIAATMSAISGLSDAPPTRKPSMSGNAESSGAFFAFAEPPYLCGNQNFTARSC